MVVKGKQIIAQPERQGKIRYLLLLAGSGTGFQFRLSLSVPVYKMVKSSVTSAVASSKIHLT